MTHDSSPDKGKAVKTTPSSPSRAAGSTPPAKKKKPFWHHLYVWVLVGIALGVAVGLIFPAFASELRWLATLFINLVKVVIAPTIFATVVVGIAGLGNLAKAGGLALRTAVYFNITTVVALGLGLIAINVFQPGAGLNYDVASFDGSAADATIADAGDAGGEGLPGFILGLIPTSFMSAFVDGQLLQVLLLAILTAIAIAMLGKRGEKVVRAMDSLAKVMFGIIKIVMWVAPIGAFGGIAFTIGKHGAEILGNLAFFMGSFWLTCLIFVFLVLGPICHWAGFSIFKYLRYIKDELLIVLGTSSSETVLPRMMTKLEAAGVPKHVVGLTIPTGYSFNLDGTAIYMSMGAIFIAQAFGVDVPIGTQIALLAFMLISSNGAAGVSGAGLVTLAASIAAFDHIIPMVGLALIVGIDRFMSEGRALTNLTGNGIGTLVIARWTKALDRDRLQEVLDNPNDVDVEHLMSLDGEEDAEARAEGESNLELASDSIDRKTEFAVGGPAADSAEGTSDRRGSSSESNARG
ncbi:C4-dicarboxylate transporter DctA [Pseudoclavibacter sp. AY1H1]|uniref:C4-dicarboxylate transporter DctA n=1 Tax=Pseudoclavibacter sp. AY1H1 TaxID=2080584 RepID=UPI000CE75B66|nr:C4-dicarboxylate transporter DctA [Pseudoclavibacter sp. AY1H1]PPF34304.1 dicarboxylate/amino acid:cation symporter [Pseudoclavibacter sp. AY1H1]